MEPTTTEPIPSSSSVETEENDVLLLTHSVQYAVQLLREEGWITNDMVSSFSDAEKEVGKELSNRILEAMDAMILVEEEEVLRHDEIDESEVCPVESISHETVSPSSSKETSEGYSPERKRTKQDTVPWSIKVKAVTAAKLHPKWSWKTIQQKVTRNLHSGSQLSKWKRTVQEGGSTLNKYEMIREWTYDRFLEARELEQQVSSRLLRQWALQGGNQFISDTFHFTASHSWMDRFKQEYKIRQRKVTRFVSKIDTLTLQDTLKSAEIFQQQVRKIISSFDADNVINTDQTGCEYKIEPKRTYSFQGEKVTEVATVSLNKMTHSYTAQYAITLSGKLLPKVFLCLQEVGGHFGVRVVEDVRKQQKELGNVHVVCTKSGKLQTTTYTEFLTSVMKPYVQTENFLLLIDSWGGQTNPVLYDEIFYDPEEENMATCTLKIIPPKCTPLCQPCDVYFFRQVKNFVKRLQNAHELIAEKREISDRKNIIKLHSLIHHQLSAPIFTAMIKYAWFASKLTPSAYDKEIFCNVNQVCFPPELALEKCQCTKDSFAFCAWCRKPHCFFCFYDSSHGITCNVISENADVSDDSE